MIFENYLGIYLKLIHSEKKGYIGLPNKLSKIMMIKILHKELHKAYIKGLTQFQAP